jgi:hypothetical protein
MMPTGKKAGQGQTHQPFASNAHGLTYHPMPDGGDNAWLGIQRFSLARNSARQTAACILQPLRGLEIDRQLELDRGLDGKFARLRALRCRR